MNPLWTKLADRAYVQLTPIQHQQLSNYIDLLLVANQRMNLTRIVDRSAAELGHIADSLTLLPFLPAGAIRIADVGSGGGVPGIPLAIARPDANVLLIEATKKKAAFLREAVGQLQLSNVQVSDERAEFVGRAPAYRESLDVVVTRATGTLDWLAEWCLALLRFGGKLLAMKGARAADELAAAGRVIHRMGGNTGQLHPAGLADLDNHVIVEITKVAPTPQEYPRLPTIAKGKPL